MLYLLERWQSGRMRRTRNALWCKPSWVQIPPSPFTDLGYCIERLPLTHQKEGQEREIIIRVVQAGFARPLDVPLAETSALR